MLEVIEAVGEHRLAKPGWWRLMVGGRWAVWLVCSAGHAGSLMDHDIASDGTVSPSVQCPVVGCGFHETIRLVDWHPGKHDVAHL